MADTAQKTSWAEHALNVAKQVPGRIAGAPVDLANLLTMAMNAAGGNGWTPVSQKPILGSEWINEKFGIPSSNGLLEASLTGMADAFSPGAVAKAMIVPAAAAKAATATAKRSRGVADDVIWRDDRVYFGPQDNLPREVIPDLDSKGKVTQVNTAQTKRGVEILRLDGAPIGPGTMLEDVLDFPELYDRMAGLKAYSFANDFNKHGLGEAQHDRTNKAMSFGKQLSPQDATSVVLHEVQHGVQAASGFKQGGSPNEFGVVGLKKSLLTSLKTADKIKADLISRGANPNELALLKDLPTLNEVGKANPAYFNDPIFRYYFQEVKQAEILQTQADEAFKRYLRIPGEAEARYTQKTFENQSYGDFPLTNYTVMPLSNLIFPWR